MHGTRQYKDRYYYWCRCIYTVRSSNNLLKWIIHKFSVRLSIVHTCWAESWDRIKGYEHDVHIFASSCKGAHLIAENMAPSAALQRTEWNRLEKGLNSQTKFLFMRLWDYFGQEVRKLKRWRLWSWATIFFTASLLFIPACRDFRVRTRIKYCKKGGFCSLRKRYWAY